MVLHLPIGLLTGLIALEIIAFFRRKPIAREVVLLMSWLLALSGIAAAASGFVLSYEGVFGGPTLDRHLQLGIAFAATAFLSAVLLSRGAQGAYRGLLLVSAGLMFPAGHLGASMTHGEDFLTAPFGKSPRAGEDLAAEQAAGEASLVGASGTAVAGEFAPVSQFLDKYCVDCHGSERAKGKLRLDSLAALKKGGKSGPGFVAGKPIESELVDRLRRSLDEDGHMPPESRDQPSDTEIQAIEAWIARQAETRGDSPDLATAEEIEAVVAVGPSETKGPVTPPASAAALQAIKQHLIHAEPIERGSNLLLVDFGAVAKTLPDESARVLIGSIREQIASLSLARMPVSDETAAAIGTLPNLRKLDLRGTGLGDSGIAAFQESGLEELSLVQTRVTDAAVDALSAMESLKRVYVWKTDLTAEGIQRLRAARQDLQVISGGESDAAALETEATLTYSSDAPIPGQSAAPAGLKPINTKCPVTGSPIDPRYSIVHEGRVIGFCCPNCPKEYWADPKKFDVRSE